MFNFKEQAEQVVFYKKIVMGVTKFKGEIDGNVIDSCSVLFAAPLNDQSGNAKGFGIAKVAYGDSLNYNDFAKMEFPCEMELAFQTVTNANGKTREVLKAVRPVPVARMKTAE